MADDFEEKPRNTRDVASVKTAVDLVNGLKKWREEQRAEYLKKQLIESQKSLQLPKDNHRQFEHLLENRIKYQHHVMENKSKNVPEISDVSSISLAADLDTSDSLQESSITGHLQRCFNDSTHSNVSVSGNKVLHAPEKVPIFSELRNPQFSDKNPEEKGMPLPKTGLTNVTTEPKRPFLKKGTGLLRFMPKSNNSSQINIGRKSPNVNKFQVKKDQLPQKTLKLKPALRKPDVPSEKAKHIRFDITDSNVEDDIQVQLHSDLPSVSQANEAYIQEKNGENPSIPVASISPENNKSDISMFGNESLNLSRESKELEEFEMLENYAQNSSFNSDSSLVQRIVQGEPTKPSCVNENYSSLPSQNITSSRNNVHINLPENSEKISLNACLEEINARKQTLHEEISSINPRIEALQKKMSCDNKEYFDDGDNSDRCSTPVNFEDRNPISECDTNIGSSIFEISPEVQTNDCISDSEEVINPSSYTCCNINDVYNNFYPEQDHEYICSDKEGTCNYCDEAYENELDSNEKSKFHSKLLELSNEIKTYKQLNANLTSAIKERNDIIMKLQKERDDFCKYKETELQKLDAHIQEERRQIKRQKETFNRYQKLRKDNPTKKERDELSSLRSEVEKLHDDLKRQKIKYNNDSRRWKSRLENAEKEKDTFKLENIRLEGQCQDLLDTLKARKKKNIKYLDDECNHIHNNDNIKHVEKKDAECQTEAKDMDFSIFQDSDQTSPKSVDAKKSKSKTHLSLFSGLEKNIADVIDKDLSVHAKDAPENDYFHPEQNDLINKSDNNRTGDIEKAATGVNLSVISVSCDSEIKEINNGNSIERIYPSGEREIIYKSGTRKVISPDGKSKKLYFHNGDIKETFSDGLIIYTYSNGMIETTLPDDTKITKFPNGQIQSHHPNGTKEIKFHDGTVHSILPDGSEEIRTADGNIIKNHADGTKVTELANGQKEIITRTYKKREFPNGSVKIIYHDGKQETRYSNGRVKIKDKDGRIIFDTKYIGTKKS